MAGLKNHDDQPCPSRLQLQALLQLSPTDSFSSGLREHLQQCRLCQATLDELTAAHNLANMKIRLDDATPAASLSNAKQHIRHQLKLTDSDLSNKDSSRSRLAQSDSNPTSEGSEPSCKKSFGSGPSLVPEQKPEQKQIKTLDQTSAGFDVRSALSDFSKAETASGSPDTDEHQVPKSRINGDLPARIGRYDILGVLGSGGMGTVYLGFDSSVNRKVAIKTIREAKLELRERLAREAEAFGRIDNPYVVRLHAFESRNGQPSKKSELDRSVRAEKSSDDDQPPQASDDYFLVMEYVEGETLAHRLGRDGALLPAEAVAIVLAASEGVQAAHDCGVLHRDIKPGNILIDKSGKVKVADFGLASFTDLSTRLTLDKQVPGTPAYLSPELTRGERPSIASDVYGLGCLLHECLTGKPALEGSPVEIINRLAQDSVPVMSLTREVPQPLTVIRNCAMRVDPKNRYASASAFAEDLRRWQRGEPISAQPESFLERIVRITRRRPRQTAVFGGIAVLMLALSAWAVNASWQRHVERERVREVSVEAANRKAEVQRQRELVLEQLHDSVFKTQDMLRERAGTLELRKELLVKAIAGMEQIVEIDGAPQMDHDAAVAHLRLGLIQLALGEAADGRKSLDRAREIYQKVPIKAEADAASCRSLAAIIDWQGETVYSQRNFNEARTHFEQALELRKMGLDIDPENPRAIGQYCSNLVRLGDVSNNVGELSKGKGYFLEAAERMNEASVHFPENLDIKRGISIVISRQLVVAMNEQDVEKSRELAGQLRERVGMLLQVEPLNLEYQNDHALALAQSARVCNMDDDFENATRFADEATQAYRKIASAEPESALAQSRLAISLHNEAQTLLSSGNYEAAFQRWQDSADIHDRLFEQHPSNTRYALFGGESWMWQGFTDLSRGRIDSGLTLLERGWKTLKAGEAGTNQQPQIVQGNEYVRRILEQYKRAAGLTSDDLATRLKAEPTESVMCAYLLSRTGRMDEALELAEHWKDFASDDQVVFVDVHSLRAAVYAAALAELDSEGAESVPAVSEKNREQRKVYSASAIAAIQRILERVPAWRAHMRSSHNFIPLRQEPDYKALQKTP